MELCGGKTATGAPRGGGQGLPREGDAGGPDRRPQSPRGSWHGAGAVPEPGLPIPPKGASRPRLLPSLASAPGWVSDTCTQSALTRRGSAGALTVRCTRTHTLPKTSLPAPQHCPNQRPVPKEAAAPGGARRPVLQVPAAPSQALPLPRSAHIRKEAAPSVSCPLAAPPCVGLGQAVPSARHRRRPILWMRKSWLQELMV